MFVTQIIDWCSNQQCPNTYLAFTTLCSLKRRCRRAYISAASELDRSTRVYTSFRLAYELKSRLHCSNVHHEYINSRITCYKGMPFLVQCAHSPATYISHSQSRRMVGIYQDQGLQVYGLESSLFKYRAFQVSFPPPKLISYPSNRRLVCNRY